MSWGRQLDTALFITRILKLFRKRIFNYIWNKNIYCGFESCRGYGCLSLVSAVCCQVKTTATSRSLVQRSSSEFGVSECDREASLMRPWPLGAVKPWVKKYTGLIYIYMCVFLCKNFCCSIYVDKIHTWVCIEIDLFLYTAVCTYLCMM
jgi:hypothetical protein